ncbi:MAG TPA: beta-galactosidase GalB [Verrucomicrobiae bacterium]|nr:beta-galactosidase GalB [Verrucomicrobiae bacterium]
MIRLAFILGLALAAELAGAASPRERICLDDHWRFTRGDPIPCSAHLDYDAVKRWLLPTGNEFIRDPSRRFVRPEGNPGANVAYAQANFDDRAWQQISLPHDWAIAGPFTHAGGGGMGRLPTAGVGWYRRSLEIPASDADKEIFLDVDGAMSYATVWCNGQCVGGWPSGYASWRVNLTPFVKFGGRNALAIRLDNLPNSSRWYPGAGLYRHVWLVKTFPVHVAHWGTQITTPEISSRHATVDLKVTVDNDSARPASIRVATEIFALRSSGEKTGAACATVAPVDLNIPPDQSFTTEGRAEILNPQLWGPPPTQKPNRYVAVTTVRQNGGVVDVYETPFGIRSLRFDADRGFFINGEHVLLKGVCLHHDLGPLGAAFNARAAQRQLEILQAMGCNAIRTAHNPPAPEFLDLADRMGFLVLDEMFDCWQRGKTPNDYHLLFNDWHEQDARAQIRRDRNHPCVFLWSIGNEVGEQYTGTNGAALAQQLCNIVHEEDPTRPVTTAMNYAKPDMPLPAVVDVIGLNYQGEGIRYDGAYRDLRGIRTPPQFDAFHQRFPNKMILETENADALSSRGEYLFPVFSGNSAPVRDGQGGDSQIRQVSAYELYSADAGASADKVFAAEDRHPFVAGGFAWTGWDYLGEPTPYGSSRSSYSGIVDLAGFRKDRFYLYQAFWRPDFPMAHLVPQNWTWPERVGKVTPVHVFTSGDEAELFLNGRSLGRKKKAPSEYRLRWDHVVYQPGTLKVIAYKNGKRWATDEVKTAGPPAKIQLTPDRDEIRADGKNLSFVTVTVTDRHGLVAPRADNHLYFSLEGPGEIVATDNGDPTDFEPFPSPDRKAFNGLCLVIVRGEPGRPGPITVMATSDGLAAGKIVIKSVR